MPPALRRYWATHSRRSGRTISRSTRAAAPAAPKRRFSLGRPIQSAWARVKAAAAPLDPISAALFAAVGYLLPNALTATGAPMAVYNASQSSSSPLIRKYSEAIDTLYNAVNATANPSGVNIWANGGASGFGKLAGIGLAADVVAKSAKTGRISARALNVEGPLALGLILDPPAGGSGSQSSVSVDGW